MPAIGTGVEMRNNRCEARGALAAAVMTSGLCWSHAVVWAQESQLPRYDDAVVVDNVATPSENPTQVRLKELWRVGGDSNAAEEMFGVIQRVTADDQGDVYLLDRQLSEVRVFDKAGRYARTIGREGEGPGEFRRPSDMFFLADGRLAILQVFPPRIILLQRDGTPSGELPFPKHDGPQMLRRAIAVGDRIALVRRIQEFHEDNYTIYATIDLMDTEGTVLTTLEAYTFTMAFAKMRLREQDFDVIQRRLSVSPAGLIYTCPTRRGYTIHEWTTDGTLKRVIQRDYESHKRSDDERLRVQRLWDTYGRSNSNITAEVDDYDKDIRTVYPRSDGTLWVLSSRGIRERPEGSLGVFDVFDAQGHYARNLTLLGQGDPLEDTYYFLGDRLFVVTNVLQADAASRGGMEGNEDDGMEPSPTEVICYELMD